MAGVTHFFDSTRFVSAVGSSTSATVYFYHSGTTNLAPVFVDKTLSTPSLNPISVASGAILPIVFLDSGVQYRRRIVFDDGTVHDEDPIPFGSEASLQEVETVIAEAEIGFNLAIAEAESAASSAVIASATVFSYPNSASTNVPRGLTQGSVGAITAGSGGTNGTFTLTWSGGNFSINPTGTFTVAGGVLTAVNITGPGLYIGASPTVPTPSFTASAGLTGASVVLTSQFLVTSGNGYWVQSVDNLTLSRYRNNSGVALAESTVGPIFTATGVDEAINLGVASASVIKYGLGAPDAITGGADGATYIETTSGRQYGPKAGGVWPSRYSEPRMIGAAQEPVTVCFMMGQSNADGWALDPANTTALTAGYGYEYYCDNGTFGSVLPLGPVRLGRGSGVNHYGGPQSAFAQTWAAGGGGAVIFVDCAIGGSTMVSGAKAALTGNGTIANLSGGTWDQDDADNIYTNSLRNHMRLALQEIERLGFRVRRQVAYYSQGETDAGASASFYNTYEAKLRIWLRQFHIDFPDCFFLVENLGADQFGATPAGRAVVRAAQATVVGEAEFNKWAKIGSTLAAGFTAANYADTLHYNQGGYNTLGTEMATQGLTFTKSTGLLPLPTATKHNDLLANMPPVDGWFRMRWKTNRSGVWGITGAISDPFLPYGVTFYDAAWIGKSDARQAPTWTYPDANEKFVWIYAHKSTAGSLSLTLSASTSLTEWVTIDDGFPLDAVNVNSGFASSVVVSDAGFYRVSSADFRQLSINATTGQQSNVTLGNATLGKLTGMTQLNLNRSPNAKPLDLTLTPLMTQHNHNASGLSVAEVNARLVALDANGLSGGTINLSQFLSGTHPASVPTGAGLTAKTSLQGKGWAVTTD